MKKIKVINIVMIFFVLFVNLIYSNQSTNYDNNNQEKSNIDYTILYLIDKNVKKDDYGDYYIKRARPYEENETYLEEKSKYVKSKVLNYIKISDSKIIVFLINEREFYNDSDYHDAKIDYIVDYLELYKNKNKWSATTPKFLRTFRMHWDSVENITSIDIGDNKQGILYEECSSHGGSTQCTNVIYEYRNQKMSILYEKEGTSFYDSCTEADYNEKHELIVQKNIGDYNDIVEEIHRTKIIKNKFGEYEKEFKDTKIVYRYKNKKYEKIKEEVTNVRRINYKEKIFEELEEDSCKSL